MKGLFFVLIPFILLALLGFAFSSNAAGKIPTQDQTYDGVDFYPVIRDFPIGTPLPHFQPKIVFEPEVIIKILRPADPKVYALSQIGTRQFACLDKLFTRESNWNPLSLNSTSGAYGIPQALPGSKMATVASDWRTNPITQVKWGLAYIKDRYGTACNAWAHSQAYNWY